MARASSALVSRAGLRWCPWLWFCLRLFSLLFLHSHLSSPAALLSVLPMWWCSSVQIHINHSCPGSTFRSLYLSVKFHFIFNQTRSHFGVTEVCLACLSCHCEVLLQTEFKPLCYNLYQTLPSSCVYTAPSKMGPWLGFLNSSFTEKMVFWTS